MPVEFLYPSCGGMEPATAEDRIYMKVDEENRKRLTHPMMDQYIEQKELPDRIDIAWTLFSAWMDMVEFKEKLEATVQALGAAGLVEAKRTDLGVRIYELKRGFLMIFGVWTSSKKLDMILEDLRLLYKETKFWVKDRPNPFSEVCELLYEIRAHNLDNAMLTLAERTGGDPIDKEIKAEARDA
jgi:hypothetical protein